LVVVLWRWVRVLVVIIIIVVCDSGAVVYRDCCGAVELAAAVSLLLVEDAEELSEEAALLSILWLFAVSEPGGHGFAGDFFKFGDVDAAVFGDAVRVLVYDYAEDVHEEDDTL
jgi:hypothetical protein